VETASAFSTLLGPILHCSQVSRRGQWKLCGDASEHMRGRKIEKCRASPASIRKSTEAAA
jgi:hypothetical protein